MRYQFSHHLGKKKEAYFTNDLVNTAKDSCMQVTFLTSCEQHCIFVKENLSSKFHLLMIQCFQLRLMIFLQWTERAVIHFPAGNLNVMNQSDHRWCKQGSTAATVPLWAPRSCPQLLMTWVHVAFTVFSHYLISKNEIKGCLQFITRFTIYFWQWAELFKTEFTPSYMQLKCNRGS